MWQTIVAILVVLVILVVVAVGLARLGRRSAAGPGLGGAPPAETAVRFDTPHLTRDIVVFLARDQYRAAYWAPTFVGGLSIKAIADTGSPYFIVPESLPCSPAAHCAPTGVRTTITYGDGTTDKAVFTRGHVDLGANHFPSLIFGGSPDAGKSGRTTGGGNEAILGLAPVKPPPGQKVDGPQGESIAEQIGARLLEFDFRDEYDAALRLAPSRGYASGGDPAAPLPGEVLVAAAPLVPRGKLWTRGVDHATDFFVVEIDQSRADPKLGQLQYLIIDTGTTMTLLPPPADSVGGDGKGLGATIPLAQGGIAVAGEDRAPINDLYQDPDLQKSVGILGNRTMTGHRIVLDHDHWMFYMFRRL